MARHQAGKATSTSLPLAETSRTKREQRALTRASIFRQPSDSSDVSVVKRKKDKPDLHELKTNKHIRVQEVCDYLPTAGSAAHS